MPYDTKHNIKCSETLLHMFHSVACNVYLCYLNDVEKVSIPYMHTFFFFNHAPTSQRMRNTQLVRDD